MHNKGLIYIQYKSLYVKDKLIWCKHHACIEKLTILCGEKHWDGLHFSCANTFVLFVWRQRGCRVLLERSWMWSVFPQGYRGSIKGRTMASAHFSLSLQQICQSCSETSLISPACSAWHSNATYRGHAGASDGHGNAAASHANTRCCRLQPIQLFQQPNDTRDEVVEKLRILSCTVYLLMLVQSGMAQFLLHRSALCHENDAA